VTILVIEDGYVGTSTPTCECEDLGDLSADCPVSKSEVLRNVPVTLAIVNQSSYLPQSRRHDAPLVWRQPVA
jgi:hypothetical protein